ncbi:hypothetical protein ONZ45_g1487 [Pleurotus djamor]|nr:hypothetical protein ONZ45_g1487 [Pleurotus djamor]
MDPLSIAIAVVAFVGLWDNFLDAVRKARNVSIRARELSGDVLVDLTTLRDFCIAHQDELRYSPELKRAMDRLQRQMTHTLSECQQLARDRSPFARFKLLALFKADKTEDAISRLRDEIRSTLCRSHFFVAARNELSITRMENRIILLQSTINDQIRRYDHLLSEVVTTSQGRRSTLTYPASQDSTQTLQTGHQSFQHRPVLRTGNAFRFSSQIYSHSILNHLHQAESPLVTISEAPEPRIRSPALPMADPSDMAIPYTVLLRGLVLHIIALDHLISVSRSNMTPPRVWLVTGASAGFGRSTTELILENDEIVVATARNLESLQDLAAKYPSSQLLLLKCDVTQKDDISSVFKAAVDTFGRVDVVFNNAGASVLAEVEVQEQEDASRRMFEVNFWGAGRVAAEAVKVFRDVNPAGVGGLLLNVSSALGQVGWAGGGYYSASKHALEGLTESLVMELDPKWNIKATYNNPGLLAYQAHEMVGKGSPLLGDTVKAVKKIFELSQLPRDEIPLYFPLSKMVFGMFQTKIKAIEDSLERFASWSENLEID